MKLRGNLPIFIPSVFSDILFKVHLGTILSDNVFHQEEGVPYGAILKTTWFNIKINNIVKQVDLSVVFAMNHFAIMYSRYRHFAKEITT